MIVISNPLDAMVYEMKKVTGFPREQVRRHGRRARQRALPAASWPQAAGVSVKDVRAMVLGGHGDTMVPCLSYCTINGVPGHAADRRRTSSTRSSSARATAAARS